MVVQVVPGRAETAPQSVQVAVAVVLGATVIKATVPILPVVAKAMLEAVQEVATSTILILEQAAADSVDQAAITMGIPDWAEPDTTTQLWAA